MIAPSELIINADGSCFHLHLKPGQLADKVVMCGDPGRVDLIASFFDSRECEVSSREFHTITGTYHGKRITALSHGIGPDNIDIVMNELDALGKGADMVMACGPMPMLRAIAAYADPQKIDAYISLEERMACGVGACLGCITKTKEVDHHSYVNNTRICTDGPVFKTTVLDI